MRKLAEWGSLLGAVLCGAVLLCPFVSCISAREGGAAAEAGVKAAGEAASSGQGWIGIAVAAVIAAGSTLLGVKLAPKKGETKPGPGS